MGLVRHALVLGDAVRRVHARLGSGMRLVISAPIWRSSIAGKGTSSIGAETMMKSEGNQETNLIPHSGQGVAEPSLTRQEPPSPAPTAEAMLAVSLLLIEGLAANALSGDVWWLAMHQARHVAVDRMGMSPEVVEDILNRIGAARKDVAKGSRMSSMFSL